MQRRFGLSIAIGARGCQVVVVAGEPLSVRATELVLQLAVAVAGGVSCACPPVRTGMRCKCARPASRQGRPKAAARAPSCPA